MHAYRGESENMVLFLVYPEIDIFQHGGLQIILVIEKMLDHVGQYLIHMYWVKGFCQFQVSS